MTTDELNQLLVEEGYTGTVILENPDFIDAIVGISDDGRLVYQYDRMVASLADSEEMSMEEAEEFIQYNTIRALPYMGDKAPIVVYSLDM